jgi:hypothetical protein
MKLKRGSIREFLYRIQSDEVSDFLVFDFRKADLHTFP